MWGIELVVWIHAFLGVMVLPWIIVTRKELMNPISKRHHHWRVLAPVWIVILGFSQGLIVAHGLFEGQMIGVRVSLFGMLSTIAALNLYVAYVRRWLADTDVVTGG